MLGLSLAQQIEFVINLLLSNALISKPSYQIIPIKLDELKKYIQKLLVKGFI